jgi:4-hydroxyphenylpyruvate dioxygenase
LHLLNDQSARMLDLPPPMPPRVQSSGCEFIEFAASHEEAEEFGQYFSALGFAPTARHRTKDVVRWQRGEINLVVNSEPEGLAHSFDIVHGGSVCAIGLAVADQAGALARAEALDIPRFASAVGPDEWEIPSIRAVGGSLLYLADNATRLEMWADEFPLPLPGTLRCDLDRIDHVAQSMHYEEFLSWLLYYSVLLDVEKTPQLEITDPMGLVYSQAVENADGSVRFALNGSLAIQSLTSRFIQSYFGGGVQHIAFTCDDVFAAAERATAAGLPMLEFGPNYYEDIEARFALDPALVARMASLDLLYDRDGEAEYFQFYSRAVAKRVFFEVVERRGYDGYGAANAAIRLNAQARHRDPPSFDSAPFPLQWQGYRHRPPRLRGNASRCGGHFCRARPLTLHLVKRAGGHAVRNLQFSGGPLCGIGRETCVCRHGVAVPCSTQAQISQLQLRAFYFGRRLFREQLPAKPRHDVAATDSWTDHGRLRAEGPCFGTGEPTTQTISSSFLISQTSFRPRVLVLNGIAL